MTAPTSSAASSIDEFEAQVTDVIDALRDKPGALLPILHAVQNKLGYIPPESLPMVNARRELYQEYFGINPDMAPMPGNIMGAGNIIDPNMFFCDAYVTGDYKKITVRTQSAPIFATTQTDGFVTFTDVLT